ncbi:hypothetical protein HD554DRAFT_2175474 [Boletus coccyginus]|nr:hypothetical protein HD554DRAFT_2175474 [Boletus coccyginus]
MQESGGAHLSSKNSELKQAGGDYHVREDSQEFMLSVGQKQKRVSSQVVVDEEEDKKDEIIEVIVLKLLKAQAGLKTLKMKCRKSKGKEGKLKKDMAPVPDSKAKGKEKGHLRLMQNNAHMVIPMCKVLVISSSQVEAKVPNFFGFSPSPESSSDQEVNNTTPCKKAKILDSATHATIKTMKLVLLTMRMKMYGMLRFLTELQACVKVAKIYITLQQLEIEEMKVLLEQL